MFIKKLLATGLIAIAIALGGAGAATAMSASAPQTGVEAQVHLVGGKHFKKRHFRRHGHRRYGKSGFFGKFGHFGIRLGQSRPHRLHDGYYGKNHKAKKQHSKNHRGGRVVFDRYGRPIGLLNSDGYLSHK